MKTNVLLILFISLLFLPAWLYAQADFETSLHATRQGKVTWYSEDNGGFEALTGVPMDSLPCVNCHAATLADGTPVDPETYDPGCADCHDFSQGSSVAQETCLGCHSRQGAEISLSQHPNLGPLFTDVHRDAGMICSDCHTKREMHGDGTEYTSMNQPGATDTQCTNDGCHPSEGLVKNSAHNIHDGTVYCSACHAKTVVTCYNCHFETEVEAGKKRFYGPPPMNGFVMLVNSDKHDGMVSTASFQSLTFGDTTFYAVGSFNGHTVIAEARDCDECHDSEIVRGYNADGEIDVVRWDDTENKLFNTKGVIPVPEDWQTALRLDFVKFTGDVEDPIDSPVDPTKWEFLKSGADATQMLFASPLTNEQMQKLSTPVIDQEQFETSLHFQRTGKVTWYSKENGGFEALTGVPMDSLGCLQCHAPTLADGTPVDVETYEPSCSDCHDFSQGTTVSQETCLGCHSRQGAEIALSQNPNLADRFSDVHRERGMICSDCHTKREMHGDGTEYASMNQPGATDTECTNEACHPVESLSDNPSHQQHGDDLYCNVCHVKTVMTCYNCHFETEVEAHKKRFFGPPPTNGFVMLINSEKHGKVATASYQSLSFGDTTFYAIGSFNGHTVTREGRDCEECHNTQLVQGYVNDGEITVAHWDGEKIVHTQGVIPVPPDWQNSLKLDFVTFTGNVTDPIDSPVDPTKWQFLKTGADSSQMLFASPLTTEQMEYLAMNVTSVEDIPDAIPSEFRLEQNYPNPFNPGTTIKFRLPKATEVTLKIYNLLGEEVMTILSKEPLAAGDHTYPVRADNLATGIYVYRLKTPEFSQTQKMTVLK